MYRAMLAVLCTTYAVLVMARSLWGWVLYLSGGDRSKAVMRKYIAVLMLRLHFRPFARELAGIAFWSIALVIILRWH